MEGVTALLAGLLLALHRSVAPDICPGSWPWAVTALGIGAGLMPTVGALIVALLRKRIGSRYGAVESFVLAGSGVVTAGLLPLLVFTATGQIFTAAVTGGFSGLGRTGIRQLGADACFVLGTQGDYLGTGSVADAFTPGGDPVRFVLALFLLGLAPIIVTVFVLIQARLALRRGPAWPSKFFWVPTAVLAFLTAGVPAGAAGQLWLGTGAGSFVGIFVLLLAGTPSREAIRRSQAPAEPARRPLPATNRPVAAAAPARPSVSERLAERFAARPAEPPVVPKPRSAPLARGPQAPVGAAAARANPPTLVGTPFPVAPRTGAKPGGPRFRLVRRLGSGGFGRVWLAQDAKLGHVVALKAAHAPDAETEQRIRREAGALAAVRHPHCVRIHDLVPARSDPGLAELDGMVIVMGYVEGSSLGDLVRSRGVLDDVAAARVWLSVAGALHAAHQQGVLHRDVKPGNVVVDNGGLAHLIDFGIARKSGDATMTQTGFVLGTPDFLSPEAACGERATPASDAWQLAATVSYALTGQPPRGGHPDAVSGLRAAASGAALSHLPRRTAHLALLQAAMDNDPHRRPPLPAVQRALSEWLQRSGAGVAGPVTAVTPIR